MSQTAAGVGAVDGPMPKGVLVAASIVILFLGLLALEISDGLVWHGAEGLPRRQGGVPWLRSDLVSEP